MFRQALMWSLSPLGPLEGWMALAGYVPLSFFALSYRLSVMVILTQHQQHSGRRQSENPEVIDCSLMIRVIK